MLITLSFYIREGIYGVNISPFLMQKHDAYQFLKIYKNIRNMNKATQGE